MRERQPVPDEERESDWREGIVSDIKGSIRAVNKKRSGVQHLTTKCFSRAFVPPWSLTTVSVSIE